MLFILPCCVGAMVQGLHCSLVVLSLKQIDILRAFATSRPNIFDALKIFTCLATQMRMALNNVILKLS